MYTTQNRDLSKNLTHISSKCTTNSRMSKFTPIKLSKIYSFVEFNLTQSYSDLTDSVFDSVHLKATFSCPRLLNNSTKAFSIAMIINF